MSELILLPWVLFKYIFSLGLWGVLFMTLHYQWKKHDCTEWTDPKNFKSYDELKSRLALVLGESAPRTVRENVSLDTSTPYVAPQASAPAAAAPMAAPAPMATAENTALDEDDTMSYFAKLAADD